MNKINFSLVALFVSVMLGAFITLGSGSAKAEDNTIIGLFIHDANLDYAIELGVAECVSVDIEIDDDNLEQLVGDEDEAEWLEDEFEELTKEMVKLCIVHEADGSQIPPAGLDSEYLTILYKAFFNRDPDPAGFDVWIRELN